MQILLCTIGIIWVLYLIYRKADALFDPFGPDSGLTGAETVLLKDGTEVTLVELDGTNYPTVVISRLKQRNFFVGDHEIALKTCEEHRRILKPSFQIVACDEDGLFCVFEISDKPMEGPSAIRGPRILCSRLDNPYRLALVLVRKTVKKPERVSFQTEPLKIKTVRAI